MNNSVLLFEYNWKLASVLNAFSVAIYVFIFPWNKGVLELSIPEENSKGRSSLRMRRLVAFRKLRKMLQ